MHCRKESGTHELRKLGKRREGFWYGFHSLIQWPRPSPHSFVVGRGRSQFGGSIKMRPAGSKVTLEVYNREGITRHLRSPASASYRRSGPPRQRGRDGVAVVAKRIKKWFKRILLGAAVLTLVGWLMAHGCCRGGRPNRRLCRATRRFCRSSPSCATGRSGWANRGPAGARG